MLASIRFANAESVKINSKGIINTVVSDYQSFYTKERAFRAAWVFAGGAALAHSNIDTDFQDFYQQDIRSSFTDDVSTISKIFGEKSLIVPLSVVLTSYQMVEQDSFLGQWGEQMFRTYLVGSPVIGITQPLTGGSRPRDKYQDATWRPFNDDNGVSGHSFVGAVPFLTLANMPHLSPEQKTLAYLASGLTAVSRINDEAHYLSQALLGWYVAWEAVDAVSGNKSKENWFQVSPYLFGDGVGISLSFTW